MTTSLIFDLSKSLEANRLAFRAQITKAGPPDEARDADGKWTAGAGGASNANLPGEKEPKDRDNKGVEKVGGGAGNGESSQPKVAYYHAERVTGDRKEGPSLGLWLSDDRSASDYYGGGAGSAKESDAKINNPLKISPASNDAEFHDMFTTEDVNSALRAAGVKFKFQGDDDQEFWRYVDDGGKKLTRALKNAGYDAISFPDSIGNKKFNSTLLFSLDKPAPPAKPGSMQMVGSKGAEASATMAKDSLANKPTSDPRKDDKDKAFNALSKSLAAGRLSLDFLSSLGEIQLANFNPSQARGTDGRWTTGGSGSAPKEKEAKASPNKPAKAPSVAKDRAKPSQVSYRPKQTPASSKTNPEASQVKPAAPPKAAEQPKPAANAAPSPVDKQNPDMEMVHGHKNSLTSDLERDRLKTQPAQRNPAHVERAKELLEEVNLHQDIADLYRYGEHLDNMHPADIMQFRQETGLRGKTAETLFTEARIAAQDRSKWQQACRKEGISVAHFKQAAKEIRAEHNDVAKQFNQMLDQVGFSIYGPRVRALESAGRDYDSVVGFDLASEHAAREYPEYFGGAVSFDGQTLNINVNDGDNTSGRFWDLILAGKQPMMSKAESFNQAFARLKDMKEAGQYRRVKQREKLGDAAEEPRGSGKAKREVVDSSVPF